MEGGELRLALCTPSFYFMLAALHALRLDLFARSRSKLVVREMAGRRVPGFLLFQRRFRLSAQFLRPRATIAKAATARKMQRVRHYARYCIQPFFLLSGGAGQ